MGLNCIAEDYRNKALFSYLLMSRSFVRDLLGL